MTDFHFTTLETKWIAHGRKTKRMHVADKTKEVPFDLFFKPVVSLPSSTVPFVKIPLEVGPSIENKQTHTPTLKIM